MGTRKSTLCLKVQPRDETETLMEKYDENNMADEVLLLTGQRISMSKS
jgi:hypothetical protein